MGDTKWGGPRHGDARSWAGIVISCAPRGDVCPRLAQPREEMLNVRVCSKVKREPRMRIGELATRSGLASTALRYYEKAGLLSPPEIREVIAIRDGGTAPCSHVLGLIERRRTAVRARIRELQHLEQELTQLAERGARLDPAECDPAGICQVIPSELAGAAASAPPASDANRHRRVRQRATT